MSLYTLYYLTGECTTCDRPKPPTIEIELQPSASNEFSPVDDEMSSSSSSNSDNALLGVFITVAVVLTIGFVFIVSLLYVIKRIAGMSLHSHLCVLLINFVVSHTPVPSAPVPTHKQPHNVQYQPPSSSTQTHDGQLRKFNTILFHICIIMHLLYQYRSTFFYCAYRF